MKRSSPFIGNARSEGKDHAEIPQDAASSARLTAAEEIFAMLYEKVRADLTSQQACALFCREMAKLLELPLVLCARRHEDGTLRLQATSSENSLWLELQRLPERWDASVVGNGPGALSIQRGIPVTMRTTEEAFMPWRQAAESEWIRAAGAWPFKTAQGEAVLELFGKRDELLSKTDREVLVPEIVRRLEAFLLMAEQQEKQRLR